MTAKEARTLAGVDDIQEEVEKVIVMITDAATKKEREIRLHESFWTNGGYSRTPEWTEACARLLTLGYDVKFFYEERQFVNMYTVVKW